MTADFSVRFFDLDAVSVDDARLSDSERERVARKATPGLRQRQAASFQCIRETLAATLGLAAASVPIAIAASGKPFLVGFDLHFNASHSEGVGLLAWSQREIGADVQGLIERPTDGLAEEILSPDELALWLRLDAELKRPWLTRAWCRKEAVLKALGVGLRRSPRSVDVAGGEGERSAWGVRVDGQPIEGHDLVAGVPPGHRAAVAMIWPSSDGAARG